MALGAGTPAMTVERLREEWASRRHGQSVYAPGGVRSSAQREHDGRELLGLLERVAFAAGRAAGLEEGRREGRREVWRRLGPQALADVIRDDLAGVRRSLEAAGVHCLSERAETAEEPFYPAGEAW